MYKLTIALLFVAHFICGQYPSGFQEESFGSWTLPMNVVFDHTNRMYVSERDGRFYLYANNQKTVLIDIRQEVATYGDFGLLSAALDPDFQQNGYVYLYYVVDRHHLLYNGTNTYSSLTNEQGATICRLTRYTLNSANGFNSVVPNSRLILIGETKSTGFPLTGIYHSGGDLKFAVDGSLLVSCGDGANGADYESQALSDGIISQEEYNARRLWRCQIQNSLNGKIIRIDPLNGNGIPSNPFYDSNAPRSARSRVYAMGFRNPFRFSIKPNTGSHSINEGNPGVLYVGDVGQETKEEINVVTAGGQNFGWPRLEGIDFVNENNPIYHPTNPKKPTIEWGRANSTARVVINNNVHNIGSSAFPFSNFVGGGAIGGVFYEGESYPEAYHGSYFFAEFNNRWVQNFEFDGNNNPISKIDFHPQIAGLISFMYNPHDECIYFTAVTGVVKKIKYTPTGNQLPIAQFTFSRQFGNSPLTVSFDAEGSYDPEFYDLSYNWNFGDGTIATGKNTTHEFVATGSNPQSFFVTLTVQDVQGASSEATNIVSLNNTPPNIISTSLDQIGTFSTSGSPEVLLNAVVSDSEEENNTLSYKWEVFFYHNDHRHQELNSTYINQNFIFGLVPCSSVLYFYRFILTVTDSHGLSSVFQKDIFPNCNTNDQTPPSFPNLKVDQVNSVGFHLSWGQITDNDALKSIEVVINNESVFLNSTATEYFYLSPTLLHGQNFNIYLKARDQASNSTKSSVLCFTPYQNCVGFGTQYYLSQLNEVSSVNGYGQFERDRSNGESSSNDGNVLKINGVTFAKGLGVHSRSEIVYDITGAGYEKFNATIGMDDEALNNGCGSVIFKVIKDGVIAYQSPVINQNSGSIFVDVNVFGSSQITLVVEDAGDGNCGDHADWAEAKFLKPCISNDIVAPNIPLNLTLTIQSSSYLLAWQSVSDNIDNQIEYEVFLNGVYLATTLANSTQVPSLPNSSNFFTVQAKDDAGNRSVSQTVLFNNCPPVLNIPQTENISNQVFIRKASEYIEAQNIVENQSEVEYYAGKSVVLNPGFSVSQSVFVVKIQGCNN